MTDTGDIKPAPQDISPTKMQRKQKDFHSLSPDIKCLIIEHVIRPTDLKNVCLVSSELHDIAVRFLYRSVSLDLGCAADTKLSAFLNPRNKGLRHIRQIRLYLANVPDRCNQEVQAAFATRMLLEFLPENILEEFSWCPWRPFSTDNLLLLYKKQKRMKWLEVMDLDRDALPDIKADKRVHDNLFVHAKKLALYPENRHTLGMAGYFVDKTAQQLEEIIIHANFPWQEDRSPTRNEVEPRELYDSATGPGLLSSTIFGHLIPFDSCTPLSNLTSIRLHRINLRYSPDTWCKFVDFSKVQSLRLYHCPGADTLLGQLSKASNLPRNLRVLELQHKDNAENEALMALDGFLCLVSGIRDMIIDLQGVKSLPAAAGIAKHSKTLGLLNVHASNDPGPLSTTSDTTDADELVYENDDFEEICKACTNVEQLSCAWPGTSLIRSPMDSWRQYESALTSNLKRLVTLHITTWPHNKPSTQLLPRTVYENLLQGLAHRVFECALAQRPSQLAASATTTNNTSNGTPAAVPGKLRLIAFGISDKIYEREDSKNQMLYIRSSALDAEGKSRIHAAPVGWCLRQFLEPRSDVLDFVLGREARPPLRPDGRDFSLDDGDGWNDD